MIFKESVNAISINNIQGEVSIELNKDNVIDVVCNNDEVPIKIDKYCLNIGETSKYSFSKGNKFVINSFGGGTIINTSNCVIINGQVVSGGGSINAKEMPKAKITIKVPFDIIKDIELSMAGAVNIEKIASKLNIDTSYSVELSIDAIDDVKLETSGQSRGIIRNTAKLDMDTSGQSKFKITNVKILNIDGPGQTNITVDGDIIEKADIDLSGQGTVSITAKEIKKINADLSGMSNVYVYGHIERKSVDKSGMSSFHYSER